MPLHYTPSVETFSSRDEKVDKLTRATEQLTAAQFKSTIKPGDVVITYVKKRCVSFQKRVSVTLTQLAQNSSFSSSKIVGKGAKEIIGYDTRTDGGLVINTAPVDSFLRTHEISLILRCPRLTADKASKVVKFMYDKKEKNTPYAYDKVFLSVFEHLFASSTDENSSDKAKKLEEDTRDREFSLFCSSVIHFAYKSAGIALKYVKDIPGDYVWPKDLLLSSDFTCIGGYFSKDSGLRK